MSDTAAQLELLRQARVHSLLKGWARGERLSAAEVAEIRALHPEFSPQPPGTAAAEGEPPAPMPHHADTEASAEQIERWSAMYGVKRRQLFRYLAIGREHGYPAPLDNPVEFAHKWWAKPRMSQRVPHNILAAAMRAAAEVPPPAAADPAAPAPPAPAPAHPIDDLDDEGLDDGEEVRIARRLVKTYRDKLNAVVHDPTKHSEVTMWDTRLKDAMKTLKEAKAADREAKKVAGLYRLASECDQQVFQMLKLLAAMREKMAANIRADLRAKLPDLAPDLLDLVIAAVLAERSREDEIFRDLGKITDADFSLAA